ncbi:fibronectin type III domain-containing protein [Cohnella rhizosphaerae]|uniref:Fibronectin type III domain-containing protein n=1 Tax=Cohnella rhizosphaerae TaxID=1457232 RepID=A0A9X4QW10_9BACL|nr:fibronectin type III domain-containing protein [Cohnella rhizosphaerae]MDG0813926.1 fibronectin type III domain-containing protein [Cohnella rhizosphaerae]
MMKFRKWLMGALVAAATLPAATASAATGASVTNVTANSLQLNWTLQPGEGVVTVYQNGSYLTTYAGNGMIVNGLTPCTAYTFTVAGGSGYGTTSAAATTLGCAPAPTAPSIAYTSTYSSVNLSWTASNAVSYEVYRDNVLLGTTSGTSYTFGGTPSRAYAVRIVALNSTGQSASASITATTQAFSGTWTSALASGNIRVGGRLDQYEFGLRHVHEHDAVSRHVGRRRLCRQQLRLHRPGSDGRRVVQSCEQPAFRHVQGRIDFRLRDHVGRHARHVLVISESASFAERPLS